MNNKLTLLSVIIAHVAVIVGLGIFGGCRSSTGMEGEPNRRAFSGFPGESGASGYEANSSYAKTGAAPAAQPAVVINPPSAVTVSEPAAAPGYESNAPAPAAVAANEPAPVAVESAAPAAVIAAPAGAGHTYTVKPNESLWIIAKREGVSVDDITAANHLNKNAILRPGQKLTIPAASGRKSVASASRASAKADSSVAVSGDTYVVKSGDVISIIARKLGTTSAALREANGLTGDNIQIGQKLKVPANARHKAAGAAAVAETKKTGAAPAAVAAPKAASGVAPAPVAVPAAGGLRDIPLMGSGVAPAPVAVPDSGAAVAPAPEPVEATPVSR